MSENNQLLSEWGDGSRNRIVDLIDASRIASNKPRRAQDFSDSYSELEFGYYADLSAANDLSEFKRKIEDSIKELGFQEFSYFRTDNVAPGSEKLVTVSSDFLAAYFNECFFEHDLIIPYANSNTAPIYQSILHDYARNAPFDINMTQMMKAIYELNKSYGYHEFYNTLAKANNGKGNVVLSVTIQGCSPIELKRIVRGCESTLQLLCEAIDAVASRKFPNTLIGGVSSNDEVLSINPRPLRVLDTLANNDFNIIQVADHLNISVVTANKHLETARKAFGARTNYAAIKKAVVNGLIQYTT